MKFLLGFIVCLFLDIIGFDKISQSMRHVGFQFNPFRRSSTKIFFKT